MTTCVCGSPMVKVRARWICSSGECSKTAPTPATSPVKVDFRALSKWKPYVGPAPDDGDPENEDDGRWWT